MNTSFADRQQALGEQISKVGETVAGLEVKLRELDGELDGLSGQRQQYDLLERVCDSLDKLEELGAAPLFWGEAQGAEVRASQLQRARAVVADFSGKVAQVEQARASLLSEIGSLQEQAGDLRYDLAEVKEREESVRFEFVVEREARQLPFRPAVMPWSPQEEDRRRFRKIVLLSLLFMFVFGGIPLIWKLPPPDKNRVVVVPDRLAQLVKKKVPPKPPEKVKEVQKDKPEETKTAKQEETKPRETKVAQTTPVEVQQARARAETKGVLAFKDSFSDLIDDAAPSELGADARVSNAGRATGGGPNNGGAAGSRSLITSMAAGGSGGIAAGSISRGGVGSGSGGAITGSGVRVARAQSAVGTGMKGADRPLTSGAGPARTDEEIQIVFDKYKAALYRIYNRELRNDPSLRGKMVLAITIEPDGRVSACRVQSTDLNSAALSADIVERVLKFNFGAKDGVPTTKILYPIDFLPAG